MRLTLFLLAFLPLNLSAQSKILDDPDVVWATLITQDWQMDMAFYSEWDKGVITLKQYPVQQSGLNYSSPLLADLVYNAFASGKLPVYKDPDCTIPQDFFLDNRTDTIVHFDPVTFKEMVSFVYEEPFPERDIHFWRIRLLLYYNKKKATWGTEVLSIAPLIEYYSYPEYIPLFWFKPINHARDLRKKDITWAKKTFSGAQEETMVFLEPDSLIKVKPGFERPYTHFLETFENKRHANFYDSRMEHKLSLSDRKKMLMAGDSILEIYPATNETSIYVLSPKCKSENVTQLRLVQIWAWDVEKSRLYVWLDAVAPLFVRSSLASRTGRGLPLFYQKIKG